jgi:hypothetical protein
MWDLRSSQPQLRRVVSSGMQRSEVRRKSTGVSEEYAVFCPLDTGPLLGSLFDLENGGDIFLRNVG